MRWIAVGLGALLLVSPILGFLSSPLAPFWMSGRNTVPPAIIVDAAGGTVARDPLELAPVVGLVSDAQRFQLARSAGWGGADAIVATAISIAENGNGNPTALSSRNSNGTFDYGELQINSAHWQACGGQQALSDPFNNFVCGHTIYLAQGWCAWSTYEQRCGPGHTGSYKTYLARAVAASQVQPTPDQA